ncbi:MAG: hypothetical protein V4490_06895, partial [Pseudomonadota bacterium]
MFDGSLGANKSGTGVHGDDSGMAPTSEEVAELFQKLNESRSRINTFHDSYSYKNQSDKTLNMHLDQVLCHGHKVRRDQIRALIEKHGPNMVPESEKAFLAEELDLCEPNERSNPAWGPFLSRETATGLARTHSPVPLPLPKPATPPLPTADSSSDAVVHPLTERDIAPQPTVATPVDIAALFQELRATCKAIEAVKQTPAWKDYSPEGRARLDEIYAPNTAAVDRIRVLIDAQGPDVVPEKEREFLAAELLARHGLKIYTQPIWIPFIVGYGPSRGQPVLAPFEAERARVALDR